MTQNDDVYAYLKTTLGISGTLNDLLFAYYKQQTGLSNVSFNDAKRAYFQQRYGKQGTINDVAYGIEGGTNLVTNPRGRNTSGTVVVRGNLIKSPGTFSGYTTASIGGGHTAEVVPDPGGNILRMTITEATTNAQNTGLNMRHMYDGPIPVAGDTLSAAIEVRLSVPKTMALYIQFLYEGGLVDTYTTVLVPAGVWTRLENMGKVVPDGNTYTALQVLAYGITGDPWQPGDVLEFRKPIVEKSSIVGPFFDGSYSPDPDLTPEWTGTPGASTSRLVGPRPVGPPLASGGALYYSASQDALAFYVTDPTAAGQVYVNLSGTYASLSQDQTYTRYVEVWTPSPTLRAFRSYLLNASITGSNIFLPFTEGRGEARQTAVGGGTFVSVNLSMQADTGVRAGDIVYFRAAIFTGDYSGPFFDGDSPNAKWNGTPHASTSTLFNPGRALI